MSPSSISCMPMKHQQGSILLISLVLMSVLTLLGLSTMRTAFTGEKISGHIQDLHLANESAESALRRGQRSIRQKDPLAYPSLHDTTVDNLEATSANLVEPPDLKDWEVRYTVVSQAEMQIGSNETAVTALPRPRYKLELFNKECPTLDTGATFSEEEDCNRGKRFYRIFGRGLGRSGENQVILQSLLIEDILKAPGSSG